MHKMYAMVDMEMDDERQFQIPAVGDSPARPRFPYGLRICLTKDDMEKLRLDPTCAFVGGLVHLHAMARITSVSSNQMEKADGEVCDDHRVELQIESMAVESEDLENEEMEEAEEERDRPSIRSLYKR